MTRTEQLATIAAAEIFDFLHVELKGIPRERRACLYQQSKAKALKRVQQVEKELERYGQ